MAYVLKRNVFYFRTGENPEISMQRFLESIGVRVLSTQTVPLSLGPGARMNVYVDLQGQASDDVMASLDANTGFMCVPVTVWVGDPNTPPPPVKDWMYEVVTIANVLVRDASGNLLPEPNRIIASGTQLKIYKEMAVIGPNMQNLTYTNRGAISRDMTNIWLDASVVRKL